MMTHVLLRGYWLPLFCGIVSVPLAAGHADDAETAVKSRVDALVAAHHGRAAVALRRLPDGEPLTWNADDPMPTASLIKLAVMVEAYRQADAGKIDLAKMRTLREEDKVPGSGILTDRLSPGLQLSLRDAIHLMIAFSDNTATNLVLDDIGLGSTAATMEQLGFPETKIHSKVYRRDTTLFPERSERFGLGSTTANEFRLLLEQLHAGSLASAESTRAMLKHLSACDSRSTLPRFLPPGIKVAHKTGSIDAARTAAGIIHSPAGPVVIVVLTNENEDRRWTADNAAEILCGRIAQAVWESWNGVGTDGDGCLETKQ